MVIFFVFGPFTTGYNENRAPTAEQRTLRSSPLADACSADGTFTRVRRRVHNYYRVKRENVETVRQNRFIDDIILHRRITMIEHLYIIQYCYPYNKLYNMVSHYHPRRSKLFI